MVSTSSVAVSFVPVAVSFFPYVMVQSGGGKGGGGLVFLVLWRCVVVVVVVVVGLGGWSHSKTTNSGRTCGVGWGRGWRAGPDVYPQEGTRTRDLLSSFAPR